MALTLSLPPQEFRAYLERLLENHIPDQLQHGSLINFLDIDRSLERVEHSFSQIKRKYYALDDHVYFDHLNADHMASFLWFLSNEVWRSRGDDVLPTKLSYLNRILHNIDLFYFVPMPDIFLLVHPVGSVIGRGSFGDYLVVYQNCTIGSSHDSYPILGEAALLYAGTKVLGSTRIGDNVVVGADSLLINVNVPSNTLVVGQHPNHRFQPLTVSVRRRCFEAVK